MSAAEPVTRGFFDVAATRVELTMRHVEHRARYGDTELVAEIAAFSAGFDEVIVTLGREEAVPFAQAILTAYAFDDEARE